MKKGTNVSSCPLIYPLSEIIMNVVYLSLFDYLTSILS